MSHYYLVKYRRETENDDEPFGYYFLESAHEMSTQEIEDNCSGRGKIFENFKKKYKKTDYSKRRVIRDEAILY